MSTSRCRRPRSGLLGVARQLVGEGAEEAGAVGLSGAPTLEQ